jgi:hypothetical protein
LGLQALLGLWEAPEGFQKLGLTPYGTGQHVQVVRPPGRLFRLSRVIEGRLIVSPPAVDHRVVGECGSLSLRVSVSTRLCEALLDIWQGLL